MAVRAVDAGAVRGSRARQPASGHPYADVGGCVMRINYQSQWGQASQFARRISGFFVYLLAALVALYDPVLADETMFKVLREQFHDD